MPFSKEATKHPELAIYTQTITCEPLVALIGLSFIAFFNCIFGLEFIEEKG